MVIEGGRPRWSSPLALLLAGLFMATQLWQPLVVTDEGYAAYGAWRIQMGELPYRDFFLNYAPGSFYFNALVFKLFGTSLVALRVADLGLRSATAYLCGLAALRAGAGAWSWLAYLAALVFLASLSMFGYAATPGMLLFFAVGLAWDRHLRQGSLAWALATGALIGLLAFVRQDFGIYAAAALVGQAALLRAIGRRPVPWKGLAAVAGTAGVLGLALFLPFVLAAGWHRMLDLLVLGPLQLREGFFVLPLPAPGQFLAGLRAWAGRGDAGGLDAAQIWVVFYGSLAALAAALGWCLWGLRRGDREDGSLLFWALAGALLLRQGLNRANLGHLYPMLLMASACLAALAAKAGPRPWALVPVALFAAFIIVQPLVEWCGYARRLGDLPLSRLERARGLPVPFDLEQAAARVGALTLPQERIYVADTSVEQGLANHTLFYFLAQRACTSYYEAIRLPLPEEDKAAITRALGDPGTGAVVLWSGWGTGWGDTPTDRALRAFSGHGERIGDFVILARHPERGR